ncbi:uncharacterized protein TOL2_C12380 [Desulfobacula toluolica Tol2]|uniref:Uncharacterized protein n=1 Tax=Desulfobacula toluolica (strain DSM 7467 / Tol2) TaxID=651182 RepID=K0NED6_DESTT|nr:uncharacterized protein TOL2_C12380 [Desulfobacula toluolica Tol2]
MICVFAGSVNSIIVQLSLFIYFSGIHCLNTLILTIHFVPVNVMRLFSFISLALNHTVIVKYRA